MTERTCSIEGCDGPVCGWGWCQSHYYKWKRWGQPLNPNREGLVGRRFGRLTVISYRNGQAECRCDCGKAKTFRGQQLVTGQALSCGTPGPCNWRSRGAVSYNTMHARIRSARGAAKRHECVDCGSPAHHWSYDHTDPNELSEVVQPRDVLVQYSLDLNHYQPRCRSCHWGFDRPGTRKAMGVSVSQVV